jgi:hypothetical protein
MLQPRSRTLRHPLGVELHTPLLVPSFSSKGFGFFPNRRSKTRSANKPAVSEVSQALEFSARFLTKAALLSAYDIHHCHLKRPKRFYDSPSVLFIDSGGYETSAVYDDSHSLAPAHASLKWATDDYRAVLSSIPKHVPLVLVSPDKHGQVKSQVQAARRFFSHYPKCLTDFLIKPASRLSKVIDVDDVLHNASGLTSFSIIGVTEKELGNSVLARVENIAKLRRGLDARGADRPIHVFGSLDPVITPLYFLAGAEIFDGLSWLRYFFHNGTSTHLLSAAVLEQGISTRFDQLRGAVLIGNLEYLRKLELEMKKLATNHREDLGALGETVPKLIEAYEAMKAEIGGK